MSAPTSVDAAGRQRRGEPRTHPTRRAGDYRDFARLKNKGPVPASQIGRYPHHNHTR
jgi:hypothetical protein